MNKIAQSVVFIVVSLCLALTFVGCSEKERTTVDINALVNTLKTDYVDFFDQNGELVITYSQSVQNLIANDSKSSLLNAYFGEIAENSYHFFNLTLTQISDKDWKKDLRIDIFNGLEKVKKSMQTLNDSKQRLETALNGYETGEINNIQESNLTNYIKEYGDFIENLQNFVNDYIEIYFANYATIFYNYDTQNAVTANDLKILLAHKQFDIAKASMILEHKYYFDVSLAKFDNKVQSNNTTKLCEELNKMSALNEKVVAGLTDITKKTAYQSLNNSEKYFDRQMEIFSQAINDFDFKKMRNSEETEQAYVEKQSYAKQQQYNDTMHIAYDYIPQVVSNYQTVFNGF